MNTLKFCRLDLLQMLCGFVHCGIGRRFLSVGQRQRGANYMANVKMLGIALAGLVALAQPASAADLPYHSAADYHAVGVSLGTWNVITFGSYSTASHVDGRAIVGSINATQTSEFQGKQGAGGQPTLSVLGNVTGSNVKVLQGNAVVGGTAPNLTVSNGTLQTGSTSVSPLNDFSWLEQALKNTSFNLAKYAATGTTTSTETAFTFTGSAPLNYFDLTAAQINGLGQNSNWVFNTSGITVINVRGDHVVLDTNFSNGNGLGKTVLWNFVDATDITIKDRQFFGSILAPLASATLSSATIDGSVVFANFAQGSNEVHLSAFTGDLTTAVPEASTWAMMMIGFGFTGSAIRRRRSQQAATA